MQFTDSQAPLSEKELKQIESGLGLKFPAAVRKCYLATNGGVPEPYVFTNDHLDTVVSEFLPLTADEEGMTAVNTYRLLVLRRKLVAPNFFPFAMDGGGDIFFVDCSTARGKVFFYNSDTVQENRLVNLKLGFADFWKALVPEEE